MILLEILPAAVLDRLLEFQLVDHLPVRPNLDRTDDRRVRDVPRRPSQKICFTNAIHSASILARSITLDGSRSSSDRRCSIRWIVRQCGGGRNRPPPAILLAGSVSPELLVGHVSDDGHGQGWLSPRARLAAVHVPHSLAILLHVARVFSGCGKHPDIRQTYSLHDTYIADLATYKVCQILKPMIDHDSGVLRLPMLAV